MSESDLLTDTFTGGSIKLSFPVENPTDTGATVSCESNYKGGTIYNLVKSAPFTGTDEEIAAEIKTGRSQPATLGPSEVWSGQTQDTPYNVGWHQEETDSYLFEFYTDTAGFDFSRSGVFSDQMSLDTYGVLRVNYTDQPAFVGTRLVENLMSNAYGSWAASDGLTIDAAGNCATGIGSAGLLYGKHTAFPNLLAYVESYVSRGEFNAVRVEDDGTDIEVSVASEGPDYGTKGKRLVTLSQTKTVFASTQALFVSTNTASGVRYGVSPKQNIANEFQFTIADAMVEQVTSGLAIPSEFVDDRQHFGYINPNSVNATTGVVTADQAPTPLTTMQGILLEDTSTNLCHYSQDFGNAYWSKATGTTVTANYAIAPDGTMSAYLIECEGSGANEGVLRWAIATSVTTRYTVSLYVRANGVGAYDDRCSIGIWIGGFVASTLKVLEGPGSVIAGTPPTVEGLSQSEWTRIAVTMDVVGGGDNFDLFIYPGGRVTSVKSLLVWQIQVEEYLFATSPIYSLGDAAVVRVATDCSKELSALGPQDFVNDFTATLTTVLNFPSTVSGDKMLLTFGTTTNGLQLKVNGDTFTLTRFVSGAGTSTQATSTYSYGDQKVIEIKTDSVSGLSIDVDGATGNNPSATDLDAPATTCDLDPGFHIVTSLGMVNT